MWFGIEPGGETLGRALWHYMVAVMKASRDVSTMPDDVKAYFLENRKQFAAGASEEVPTTGWIRKEIDLVRGISLNVLAPPSGFGHALRLLARAAMGQPYPHARLTCMPASSL